MTNPQGLTGDRPPSNDGVTGPAHSSMTGLVEDEDEQGGS